MLAYNDLRVRCNEIGPLQRNRADGRIVDLRQKAPSIGVAPLEADEAQLLMAAGAVSRVRAAPMWRRVNALK